MHFAPNQINPLSQTPQSTYFSNMKTVFDQIQTEVKPFTYGQNLNYDKFMTPNLKCKNDSTFYIYSAGKQIKLVK